MSRYKRKERNGFTLYHSIADDVELLTDSEAGLLLKSAFRYSRTGEVPGRFQDRMVQATWSSIKNNIDYSCDQWQERCIKNAYTAYKRIEQANKRTPLEREEWEEKYYYASAYNGRPSSTIVNHCQPSLTSDYQIEIERENEIEFETELEIESEKEGVRGREEKNNAAPPIDSGCTTPFEDTEREQRIAEIMRMHNCSRVQATMLDSEDYARKNKRHGNQRNAYLEADADDKLEW